MNKKEQEKVVALLGKIESGISGQSDRVVHELRVIKNLLALLIVRGEE